jgi:hypothetical protein
MHNPVGADVCIGPYDNQLFNQTAVPGSGYSRALVFGAYLCYNATIIVRKGEKYANRNWKF